MIRITVDTNILISASITQGHSYQLIDFARAGKFTLVISLDILEEFLRVISRTKFSFSPEKIKSILKDIISISDIVIPTRKISFIKSDPSDNIILEVAVAGLASYIVSGDQHLLELREYEGIKIIRLAEMLKLLDVK